MKTLRFLSALLLLCLLPVRAFAMNTELAHNSSEWYNRADIKNFYFEDDEDLSQALLGFCKYYLDFSDHCFYIHLSYEALNAEVNKTSNIYLHFNIKNSSNEYDFNINKNGFYESDESAMKAFNAEAEFGNLQNNGQLISAGIEFLNKEDKKLNNTIEITLHIRGVYHYAYKIPVNDKLNFSDYAASLTTAKPTTTKHTTTKHTTTKHTTTKHTTEAKTTTGKTTEKSTEKQTATKATTETPGAEKTTKPKPESTTKFKYIPTTAVAEASTAASTSAAESAVVSSTNAVASTATAATEKHSNSPIDGGTAFVYENTTENKNGHGESSTATKEQTQGEPADDSPSQNGDIIIPEAQNAGSLSPQAKLLAALAIVFAVLGTALIIRSLPKKEKVDENDNNEEKDE